MEDMLRENWQAIVGVVVLVVLIGFVWRLIQPKKKVIGEDMTLNVRCRSCNWQGTVTRYNQVCRKCNGTDLQQLGRPK